MESWDTDVSLRSYVNDGNGAVAALVPTSARRVLDIGCGVGGTARLLRVRQPDIRITGISASESEAHVAAASLSRCVVADIEQAVPFELAGDRFDTLIFSHVLEHLRRPEQVVARFTELLEPCGTVVIAVPNVACWRDRVQFALGRFEYSESGTLDSTHLRFFTYETAARYLLSATPSLSLVHRTVTGSVPLWPLRRWPAAAALCGAIDAAGCAIRPNLFGSQVLLRAVKGPADG